MNIIKNYDELKNIIEQNMVLIIAKTKTCNVCKPITDKLQNFMKDYPNIPAYEVYLEDVEMFQGQHLVFTVPTVLIFSEGQEILRESRFIDFGKIERLFNIYIN